MMRAKVSVVAPPGDGTMILISLAGYVCAWLQTGMPNPIVAIIKSRTIVFMSVVGVLFCKYRRFSPSNTHQCYRQLRNSPRSSLTRPHTRNVLTSSASHKWGNLVPITALLGSYERQWIANEVGIDKHLSTSYGEPICYCDGSIAIQLTLYPFQH